MTFAPFLAPERDEALPFGRPKRAGETYYCVPGVGFESIAASITAAGVDFYEPWFTLTPIVIDQLAIEVLTASASTNVRIGFYRADRDWQPLGAPLVDSGSISSASTGVKTFTPGTPIHILRGRYLSIRNCDSAAVDFRAYRGVRPNAGLDSALGATILSTMRVTRAYAAFPTPGTAWDTEGLAPTPQQYTIVYRLSVP